MPESATSLPRARARQNPVWLDAIDVYKHGFDATTPDSLAIGAESFAELSPDDQAFHQAHLTFRQVQALGDVHLVLRRIDARLAGLDADAIAGLRELPVCKKALVSIARGQNQLLKMVAQGGLAEAVRGDDDDGDDDADSDDDDPIDDEDEAVIVETEDHGTGSGDAVTPDLILPAGAARPSREPA